MTLFECLKMLKIKAQRLENIQDPTPTYTSHFFCSATPSRTFFAPFTDKFLIQILLYLHLRNMLRKVLVIWFHKTLRVFSRSTYSCFLMQLHLRPVKRVSILYNLPMKENFLGITLEIFFQILTMEIVWNLVENSMEIQFSYTNCNFHILWILYGNSMDILWISMEIVWIYYMDLVWK